MHKYKSHVKAEPHEEPIHIVLAQILKALFGKETGPLLIAVGGPGGTGKSTLSRLLADEIPGTPVLRLDDYKTARSHRAELNIYGPHPDANKIELIHEHLAHIKDGSEFHKPVYCSKRGAAHDTEPFVPAKFNILDGEISTYRDFRDVIDFAIFVDAHWTTQLQTRTGRDIEERGYSPEKAIATFLHSNLREFPEFGAESKNWADVHVHCHEDYRLELDSVAEELAGILQDL